MHLSVILPLLLSVASINALDIDTLWERFKIEHTRVYTRTEEFMRRRIFESNVEFIVKHNLEYFLGLHTYTVGINKFTDWTAEEYSRVRGFKGGDSPVSFEAVITAAAPHFRANIRLRDLPTSVDWRTKGYVTPIKDQAQCGSCWAFSATGSLEGQHFRKYGQLNSLSEQQLVDCSWEWGNEGCGGGWMDSAFRYVMALTKQGANLDLENCYVYHANDQVCLVNQTSSCAGSQDVGFVDIKKGNETDLQVAVATVGPVAVAIDASNPSFQMYRDGIYNEPGCSSTQLDHGVLAVGYGNQNGQDYWIVKNSWGISWGNQGYILMSRNKQNQCGISTAASYPIL